MRALGLARVVAVRDPCAGTGQRGGLALGTLFLLIALDQTPECLEVLQPLLGFAPAQDGVEYSVCVKQRVEHFGRRQLRRSLAKRRERFGERELGDETRGCVSFENGRK